MLFVFGFVIGEEFLRVLKGEVTKIGRWIGLKFWSIMGIYGGDGSYGGG